MAFQLKIIGPRGEDILLKLCENEDQMRKITVQQLKKKIAQGLKTSTFNASLTYYVAYM